MNCKFPTVSKRAIFFGVADDIVRFNYENVHRCSSRENLHVQNYFTSSALSSGKGKLIEAYFRNTIFLFSHSTNELNPHNIFKSLELSIGLGYVLLKSRQSRVA